jgi:hypothetical protein
MPSKIVLWDLKQEMRRLCPEAAQVVGRCLKSEDDKIALAAAEIAFERGFGRVELHLDAAIEHRFVVAPDVMPIGEWLERRGQSSPGNWPRDAAGTRGPARARPVVDLTAEKPESEQPPAPAVGPSKLLN